jgi:hypothetical protein
MVQVIAKTKTLTVRAAPALRHGLPELLASLELPFP